MPQTYAIRAEDPVLNNFTANYSGARLELLSQQEILLIAGIIPLWLLLINSTEQDPATYTLLLALESGDISLNDDAGITDDDLDLLSALNGITPAAAVELMRAIAANLQASVSS